MKDIPDRLKPGDQTVEYVVLHENGEYGVASELEDCHGCGSDSVGVVLDVTMYRREGIDRGYVVCENCLESARGWVGDGSNYVIMWDDDDIEVCPRCKEPVEDDGDGWTCGICEIEVSR